jgi:hypothetical protein
MKGKMGPLRLCSLLLAISLCSCSFGVYNLQALGESNSGLLAINYSIANFGFVPYGKTIIGRLMSSPNFSSECGVVEGNGHNYGTGASTQRTASCSSRAGSASSSPKC